MRARVVIVGGGVMGVSIAWHAASRADPVEEPVVLLEKEILGAGESGRSGAILRQHYSQREVASMARDSLRVFTEFERRTGRPIGFQRTGVLTLAAPDRLEDLALIERNIAMQVSIGIDTRRVEAAEIRTLVPGISVRDGSVGAYEPDGGGVDPVATVGAFAALAREKGAVLKVGARVTGLLRSGSAVVGVETTEGPIQAQTVVVAAGPWTKKLLLGAGIDLPLRAVRPEQHFLAMPGVPRGARPPATGPSEGSDSGAPLSRGASARPPALEPAAHPVLLDLEHGFYARCESHPSRDGLPSPRTRIGRMDYSRDAEVEDPDALDEEVSAGFPGWARSCLKRRMPVYRGLPDVGSLVGMYTLSPDAQALIGPIRDVPGLLVVSGFSGHGFKLAPSIGEGLAQMLWEEPVSAFDERFFTPERFRGRSGETWGRAFGL